MRGRRREYKWSVETKLALSEYRSLLDWCKSKIKLFDESSNPHRAVWNIHFWRYFRRLLRAFDPQTCQCGAVVTVQGSGQTSDWFYRDLGHELRPSQKVEAPVRFAALTKLLGGFTENSLPLFSGAEIEAMRALRV